jgi:hypothetical protein
MITNSAEMSDTFTLSNIFKEFPIINFMGAIAVVCSIGGLSYFLFFIFLVIKTYFVEDEPGKF